MKKRRTVSTVIRRAPSPLYLLKKLNIIRMLKMESPEKTVVTRTSKMMSKL
jgi:hypothetical protein